MIDTDKYEGHTPAPWRIEYGDMEQYGETYTVLSGIDVVALDVMRQDVALLADAPLLLEEVKRLQSEPTVTVDDYHKKGHLYVTVRFPDGDEYVGLVEKWEGEEE